MIPASLRLSWATRSADNRGVIALATGVSSLTFGVVLSLATHHASPFLVHWCASIAAACLIAIDFPGGGQPRWSELELSLPIAPRARARARLLLSLGIWLLPALLAFGLSQLGAFNVGERLPLATALIVLGNSAASVLLAVAVRFSLGLGLLGSPALLLRLLTLPIVIVGAARPAPAFGAVVLLVAAPLLALAHRAASRAPELMLQPGAPARSNPSRAAEAVALATASSARIEPVAAGRPVVRRASGSGQSLARVALGYSAGTPYAGMLLVMLLLWSLGVNGGWFELAATHALLLWMLVFSHAMWSTRWLRLGHLPVARGRLFRYLAWPPLLAISVGLGLSFALPAEQRLARIELRDGATQLTVPHSSWALTTGAPPLISAANGESHRPRPQTFGLGSALVAYNPYEVPPGASESFLAHQLRRLLEDQRGLALSVEQVEQRYLSGPRNYRTLDDERYPELRDPAALRLRLIGAAALILGALGVLHLVILPGAAPSPRRQRMNPGYLVFFAIFCVSQLAQLGIIFWENGADPAALGLAALGRPLADNAALALAAAAALGPLLYRNLLRRFAQMEAPQRAHAMDAWFIEI